MTVQSLKILKEGNVTIEGFESGDFRSSTLKHESGTGGGSTVTYIESDIRIVVDTGFDYLYTDKETNYRENKRTLTHSLHLLGLSPKDIDLLFITHPHGDHINNHELFSSAEIVMGGQKNEIGSFEFTRAKHGQTITKGVQVISTPGHTRDHSSLIVELVPSDSFVRNKSREFQLFHDCIKVVIAGDAIVTPVYYYLEKFWEFNPDFLSHSLSMDSYMRIIKVADYIIPGHGNIFENVKKAFLSV